jgi:hypothetical protein
MIPVFFTARQLIGLDILPKGQKCNQEHFAQNRLPSLLNDKKYFRDRKPRSNFLRTWATQSARMGIESSMNSVA